VGWAFAHPLEGTAVARLPALMTSKKRKPFKIGDIKVDERELFEKVVPALAEAMRRRKIKPHQLKPPHNKRMADYLDARKVH
jgi:hypothetical protein